jgi:hypothetical protein
MEKRGPGRLPLFLARETCSYVIQDIRPRNAHTTTFLVESWYIITQQLAIQCALTGLIVEATVKIAAAHKRMVSFIVSYLIK